MRAENITGPVAFHGEGPCWSESWGGLRFVDALAGDLLTLNDGGARRLRTGEAAASFVRPRARGGYVIGTVDGIALADSADAPTNTRIPLLRDASTVMNDGGTLPDGRLLAGAMTSGGAFTAPLFLIDADLSHRVLADDIACSNGVAVSADESRAYYVDSLARRIDTFDLVDGELTNRRAFVAIPSEDGLPDGLTVDSEGNIWVALWGSGHVRAYDQTGRHVETIELPTPHVSACTFGDDGLGTLYITTSRQGIHDTDDTDAGSLFQVRPGTTGLPVVPFAG